MAKIHMLPLHEAQKIAAGEVVERPASVVKELLENALDAGATRITLSVKDGGKSLIRIVDDGCGMHLDDARMCIQKHATSKIKCIDDLNAIATFGFRGEALAALAAVSRMTLITKEACTHEGIKLTIECGEIIKQEPIAAPTGTTIEIADLFYNVPARQKFLKKRETELRHIQQLFQAMSLAHPTVHMSLYSEDSFLAQYTPASIYKERCAQVVQSAGHQTLLSLSETEHGVQIHGVISDHQWFKYDRSGIFLFVNKRWIKNQTLARAVMRGYSNILPPDRFPVVCLMLEISADEIDVNVHPRKEEVQFVHAHRVETMVTAAIKRALTDTLTYRIAPAVATRSYIADMKAPSFGSTPLSYSAMQKTMPIPQEFNKGPLLQSVSIDNIHVVPETSDAVQQTVYTHTNTSAVERTKQYQILGQLYNTYIIVQTNEGLLLVDQHAAHECVLYALFESRFEDVATTQLLFPELVTLSQIDWDMFFPHIAILYDNGIIVEQFGQTQLRVTATPIHLKHASIEELIRYMIRLIHEYETLEISECTRMIHKKLRAQMACKAAVKAGDVLEESQMQQLLHDLYSTEDCLTCPHGRPTYWQISQYEIEKKFKRII